MLGAVIPPEYYMSPIAATRPPILNPGIFQSSILEFWISQTWNLESGIVHSSIWHPRKTLNIMRIQSLPHNSSNPRILNIIIWDPGVLNNPKYLEMWALPHLIFVTGTTGGGPWLRCKKFLWNVSETEKFLYHFQIKHNCIFDFLGIFGRKI